MILNFSVRNFGPVREKQTLSFEAENDDHLEDHYVIKQGKYRVLKLGLIYGANASGKTTILKALEFLRGLVLYPEEKKTKDFEFNPFLFDSNSSEETSGLSIEFLQKGIKYIYEVEFIKTAIIKEVLYYHNPNKAIVFERSTNLKQQFTEISFGSKIKIDKTSKKSLEINTLWNNTVLGGFLKTNIELIELIKVTDWFNNYLRPLVYTETNLNGYITRRIAEGEVSKKSVLSILSKADFHISDIVIQQEEKEIPPEIIDLLELSGQNDELNQIKSVGKLKSFTLKLEHTIDDNSYYLPFELESQGTKRFYAFSGLLSLLLEKSVLFSIDELEASLHPDLFKHFLLSFLVNSKHSQIIATTHNREVLNDRDLFRDDAIWITDNSEEGATKLYSLADFDSSTIRDTSNRLNAYISGKLGGVPNLGDIYINID